MIFPRQTLADRLPFMLKVTPSTILTRSSGLLQVAHLSQPDLDASSPAEIDAHFTKIGTVLGRLGEG